MWRILNRSESYRNCESIIRKAYALALVPGAPETRPWRRLTPGEIDEVLILRRGGIGPTEIARRLKRPKSTVEYVLKTYTNRPPTPPPPKLTLRRQLLS